MGDDEEMMETSEAPLEMSDWLKNKCNNLWDIYNTRQLELKVLARNAELGNRLTVQQERAKTWDRHAIMEYHMGNIYASTNGAIKWALVNNNKIKALKYYLIEIGEGTTPEQMKYDLDCAKNILNADGQDEVKWAYIENMYNYWQCLDEEELYAI